MFRNQRVCPFPKFFAKFNLFDISTILEIRYSDPTAKNIKPNKSLIIVDMFKYFFWPSSKKELSLVNLFNNIYI